MDNEGLNVQKIYQLTPFLREFTSSKINKIGILYCLSNITLPGELVSGYLCDSFLMTTQFLPVAGKSTWVKALNL